MNKSSAVRSFAMTNMLLESELDKIEGIGYKTAQQLLWKFKSVVRIKKSTLTELENTISKKRAKVVFDYFNRTQ